MTKDRWRRLTALVAVLALALVGPGCGDDDEPSTTTPTDTGAQVEEFGADTTMGKIQQKGEIVIGVKYDVPPFGFKNPRTNQVEGFDVDFGKAIAESLGVEPKFIEAI